ncbi:MAG: hypothetical protein ACYTHN_22270 [Planctomycetota bacterium]|jgi:hypothetical protein
MRSFSLVAKASKIALAVLVEYVRLQLAVRKSRRAFKRALEEGGLPAPAVQDLVKEYDVMKDTFLGDLSPL